MLARMDESRLWIRIDGLAEDNVMLTVAILSTVPLNLSNALSNEETPPTRLIGLSVPRAVLWGGGATVLIPDMAFFASSRAVTTAETSGVSNWYGRVSWLIHIRVWMENWT